MGYGYGVWLIINDSDWISTLHVPHVTIGCFMSYHDARALYNDIANFMKTKDMQLKVIDKAVTFDNSMYPDDDNDLHAWGYNLTCDYWQLLRAISIVYKCNFSHTPHTAVEYKKDPSSFNKVNAPISTINCSLALVDITSDDPCQWRKI